ncbi:MAG: tetratricopeptide repeat-containing diguanylate cyclase [Marinicella sp.]
MWPVTKKSVYYSGLLLLCLLCSRQLWAQTNPSIADLIQQCQSLEDDKPQEAIEIAKSVIEKIDQSNNPVAYGQALGCIGWSYAALDQFDQSRQKAFQLEKLASGLNESAHRVTLQRRAGSIFHRLGDRINATENYQAAMLMAQKLGLEKEQIPLLVNLGVLNSEIRAHQKAIDNYYQALALMERIDDFNYHAPVLFNLAVTLSGQNRYQEALDTYQKVEAQINEHWPVQRVAQVYFGLATVYAGLEQKEKAQSYIEKVQSLLGPDAERNLFYYGFVVFKALEAVKNGHNEGALQIANEATDYYFSTDNQQLLTSTNTPLNVLASLYEELGEPEKAIKIHKAARSLEQQFQDSFNRKTMSQMQARLDDLQRNEELAVLKAQNQQNERALDKTSYQRSIMIITIVFLLIILSMILFWQQHSKRQLIKLTTTDPLTGTKNRRGIAMWNQSYTFSTGGKDRYLWLIDIDNFRKLNDEIGHDVGDTALKTLADELRKFETTGRCLGRWGGEEFLLITQDLDRAQLNDFAQEILATIAATEIVHGMHRFSLQASIGVSCIRDNNEYMWNRAVSQADKALYVAKERGRNCMVVATDF